MRPKRETRNLVAEAQQGNICVVEQLLRENAYSEDELNAALQVASNRSIEVSLIWGGATAYDPVAMLMTFRPSFLRFLLSQNDYREEELTWAYLGHTQPEQRALLLQAGAQPLDPLPFLYEDDLALIDHLLPTISPSILRALLPSIPQPANRQLIQRYIQEFM